MSDSNSKSSPDPFEIVVLGDIDSPHDALRSLIQSMCSSFAKQINTTLQIISEKYNISKDDLEITLKDDPRFVKSFLSPSPCEIVNPPKTLTTKKGKKVIIKKPLESG